MPEHDGRIISPDDPRIGVLRGVYRDAARDLIGLLGKSDFRTGRAVRLLEQVDAISRRLGEATDAWSIEEVRRNYIRGAARTDADLRALRLPVGEASLAIGAEWLRVNEGAVEAFATQIARDLAGANRAFADNARRIIRKTSQKVLADPELSRAIAKGLVSGGSLNKISRGLRARLSQAGQELLDSGKMTAGELQAIADFQAGYIQAGKQRMNLTRYCGLVAHYQLGSATIHAQRQRLRHAGERLGDPEMLDLVVVTGPISGDWCDLYVGKVFSDSGRSGEWPPVDEMPEGGPLFHPNCTHDLAPFIAPLASSREIERGRINEMFVGVRGKDADRLYRSTGRIYAARRDHNGYRVENGRLIRSSRATPVAMSGPGTYGSGQKS